MDTYPFRRRSYGLPSTAACIRWSQYHIIALLSFPALWKIIFLSIPVVISVLGRFTRPPLSIPTFRARGVNFHELSRYRYMDMNPSVAIYYMLCILCVLFFLDRQKSPKIIQPWMYGCCQNVHPHPLQIKCILCAGHFFVREIFGCKFLMNLWLHTHTQVCLNFSLLSSRTQWTHQGLKLYVERVGTCTVHICC